MNGRRVSALVAGTILLFLGVSCELGHDDDEWHWFPLDYSGMLFRSIIPANGDPEVLSLYFYNDCLPIRDVSAEFEDGTLRVSGEMGMSNGLVDCGAPVRIERKDVVLPALPEGSYPILAGDLRDTLHVTAGPGAGARRLVIKNNLYFVDDGCHYGWFPDDFWAIDGSSVVFQDGLHLLWIDETDESACLRETVWGDTVTAYGIVVRVEALPGR